MFKRWYDNWKKRVTCDHEWYDIDIYHSTDAGTDFVIQYCPICDKKRDKSVGFLKQENAIKKIKKQYEGE